MKSLAAMKEEITLLIKYAAPAESQGQATALLEEYEVDALALHLLHTFYSYLPEGIDDAIREIRIAAQKDGLYLLCALTLHNSYLYLATMHNAEFLGPLAEGIWEEEVLAFYGFRDREAFMKAFPDADAFSPYIPLPLRPDCCTICGVEAGRCHVFGCPIEICPWCGGQVVHCDCRFRLLRKDELTSEIEANAFLRILEGKGRIPFHPANQRITFHGSAVDHGK